MRTMTNASDSVDCTYLIFKEPVHSIEVIINQKHLLEFWLPHKIN